MFYEVKGVVFCQPIIMQLITEIIRHFTEGTASSALDIVVHIAMSLTEPSEKYAYSF